MHQYSTVITLRDADAGGVLFFARYYTLAHEAFEDYMESQGLGFGMLFDQGRFIMPVIRSDCEYRRSLRLGERVEVRLRATELKRRMFALECELRVGDEQCAKVKTSHVAVNLESGKAIPLPAELVAALEPLLQTGLA